MGLLYRSFKGFSELKPIIIFFLFLCPQLPPEDSPTDQLSNETHE